MKSLLINLKIIFLSRIFFSLFNLFIIFPKYTQLNECSQDDPCLKIGECNIEKNKTHYENCKISNIIKVGEKNFSYLSFASYQNEDLIFSTTAYPSNTKRIFWGIKKNGRPFFKNETAYLNIMYSNSNDTENYEFQSIIIKLSKEENKEKEYLLRVGKIKSNAEIYDFEEGIIYDKPNEKFSQCYYIQSFRNTAEFAFYENNSYYYLFGFTEEQRDSNITFHLEYHTFESIRNFKNEITLKRNKIIGYSPKKKYGLVALLQKVKILHAFF